MRQLVSFDHYSFYKTANQDMIKLFEFDRIRIKFNENVLFICSLHFMTSISNDIIFIFSLVCFYANCIAIAFDHLFAHLLKIIQVYVSAFSFFNNKSLSELD